MAWRRGFCVGLAFLAVVAVGIWTVGEDFQFGGGALTTANGSAWGGVARTTYGAKFDFSAGPTEIEIVGLDLTDTGYSGVWGWPPTADDQGAQARFGITGSGFWSLHSVHSAFAYGGSWDQQGATWSHDTGFRKYLIQNQYSGWTTGTTKGNHQYNVEAYVPRPGTGPSVNDASLVTDRAYNTFDMKIVYTPTGTPGQYVVQGWVRLYKAASTTEMATRPGTPTWGSSYTWVWNKAMNNQANPEAAWVPFYDGTWNVTGDFTSAQPFVEIMNWGVPQVSSHSLQWAYFLVSGTPAPVHEAWVDDSWLGLGDGVQVSGHYIGFDASATIQGGLDQLAGGTLTVEAGTYADPVTVDGGDVTLISANGTEQTTINGSLLLNSANVIIGRMGNGFSIHSPIAVGAGVDASTIHINWNDIYAAVANSGDGWLDATYNYWGANGPDTVGLVNVYPYLPVTTNTLIGYVNEYGYAVGDAITFAELLVAGTPLSEAELIVLLTTEFGLSTEEAAALINEYGRAEVNRAAIAATDLADLMLHLVGYATSLPSGGAGGGAGGDLGGYPVGTVIPLFLAVADPFTGEDATDALVTYTLSRTLDGGILEIVRFGVMGYDASAGGFSFALDTTGLAAGEYDVYLGTDDGQSVTYKILLTE